MPYNKGHDFRERKTLVDNSVAFLLTLLISSHVCKQSRTKADPTVVDRVELPLRQPLLPNPDNSLPPELHHHHNNQLPLEHHLPSHLPHHLVLQRQRLLPSWTVCSTPAQPHQPQPASMTSPPNPPLHRSTRLSIGSNNHSPSSPHLTTGQHARRQVGRSKFRTQNSISPRAQRSSKPSGKQGRAKPKSRAVWKRSWENQKTSLIPRQSPLWLRRDQGPEGPTARSTVPTVRP